MTNVEDPAYLNDSENLVADAMLDVIDFASRVLHAVPGSHYMWDKSGQLSASAARLHHKLSDDTDEHWERLPDPIDRDKVAAFVAHHAQHYALGRALYPGGKAPVQP